MLLPANEVLLKPAKENTVTKIAAPLRLPRQLLPEQTPHPGLPIPEPPKNAPAQLRGKTDRNDGD